MSKFYIIKQIIGLIMIIFQHKFNCKQVVHFLPRNNNDTSQMQNNCKVNYVTSTLTRSFDIILTKLYNDVLKWLLLNLWFNLHIME
jgi:hypothetical protein